MESYGDIAALNPMTALAHLFAKDRRAMGTSLHETKCLDRQALGAQHG